MSDKLKKLQIKKLIQEYEFLLTESEYVKEIVDENKSVFLDAAQEVRKKLNIPIPEPKTNNENVESESINEKKPHNISDSTKSKVKKIYREIVKLTHPDKTNSEKMIEIYRNATMAADNHNILDLFQICVELQIPIELDMDDIDVLKFLIKIKKDDIKKIESSFIWLWLNAKTEDEKNKLIELFVKQTS